MGVHHMDKITFEEAELVEILDGMADIQLTADRIRAVYLDIYEFVSEYDDKTSEDVNDNKYMIYADIVLEQIEKLFPEFYITEKFYAHLEENQDWGEDDYYYEDYELRDQYGNYFDSYNHGYMEEETYDRYNGTYAQDVAGHSDDEIDTIFEGDPSAYWNID